MIFCVAVESLLGFVRETLLKFWELSSLVANLGKSSMFVARVDSEFATLLIDSMGFALGHLLVCYLGLPFLFNRLRLTHCVPLIQRITCRIRCWASRVLSFTGR